jgi:orotidine-5'-phosphate decarboxylase
LLEQPTVPQHFADRLVDAVQQRGNPVVVGLDPRWELLPEGIRAGCSGSYEALAGGYAKFCEGVVDVVAALVPAVKVQAAFFEELGPAGMAVMADVIAHARGRALLVIIDGKRNDIGSTALAYARGYLGSAGERTPNASLEGIGSSRSAWGGDALTVSPYLGDDSLAPFVEVANERGAGVFVLVKTSNPGGRMLQDLPVDGEPLYRRVAAHVEELAAASAGACGYGSIGAVVGATYPQQLVELRAAMPHAWFLVPGYGSQGGTAADVAGGFDARGLGAIVNNSRGILYAHSRPEYTQRFGAARWQDAVDAATREMIEALRTVIKLG